MLVLGLRLHEEVVIDVPAGGQPRRIVVRLADITRWTAQCLPQAKLGFLAAREIRIHRRNLLDRIEAGGAAQPKSPTAAAPEP